MRARFVYCVLIVTLWKDSHVQVRKQYTFVAFFNFVNSIKVKALTHVENKEAVSFSLIDSNIGLVVGVLKTS